jgi:hypothetical protein
VEVFSLGPPRRRATEHSPRSTGGHYPRLLPGIASSGRQATRPHEPYHMGLRRSERRARNERRAGRSSRRPRMARASQSRWPMRHDLVLERLGTAERELQRPHLRHVSGHDRQTRLVLGAYRCAGPRYSDGAGAHAIIVCRSAAQSGTTVGAIASEGCCAPTSGTRRRTSTGTSSACPSCTGGERRDPAAFGTACFRRRWIRSRACRAAAARRCGLADPQITQAQATCQNRNGRVQGAAPGCCGCSNPAV